MMQKNSKDQYMSSKRPHCSGKEDNSSTDEELPRAVPRKPREKKIKERTSPATTDTEGQDYKLSEGQALSKTVTSPVTAGTGGQDYRQTGGQDFNNTATNPAATHTGGQDNRQTGGQDYRQTGGQDFNKTATNPATTGTGGQDYRQTGGQDFNKTVTNPAATDNGAEKDYKPKVHGHTQLADRCPEIQNIVTSTEKVSLKSKEVINIEKQPETSGLNIKDDAIHNANIDAFYDIDYYSVEKSFQEEDTSQKEDNDDIENEEKKEAKRLEEVRETYEKNAKLLNEEINEINKYWEGKDISIKPKPEPEKNPFLYDYLGQEVDRDEAEALEALSLYWLNNIAIKACKPKSNVIREEDKAFYQKYCNGTKELNIEVAMRLMSLPHVVTVTLKSIPKIEVIVSDVALAIQDSPELQSDDYEITEAMGMHLF